MDSILQTKQRNLERKEEKQKEKSIRKIESRIRSTMISRHRSAIVNFLEIEFEKLVCEDISAVRIWLENQFTEGMSWDNYGDWHIDHKTPISAAKNLEEFKILSHYTNLQPLWALDNVKKGGVRRKSGL